MTTVPLGALLHVEGITRRSLEIALRSSSAACTREQDWSLVKNG